MECTHLTTNKLLGCQEMEVITLRITVALSLEIVTNNEAGRVGHCSEMLKIRNPAVGKRLDGYNSFKGFFQLNVSNSGHFAQLNRIFKTENKGCI